jgi:hypothetical protein
MRGAKKEVKLIYYVYRASDNKCVGSYPNKAAAYFEAKLRRGGKHYVVAQGG